MASMRICNGAMYYKVYTTTNGFRKALRKALEGI